jgi:IS5 family transposase
VKPNPAIVRDLTPASDLLHGEETVVYAGASDQGIEKRPQMKGKAIGFRVAMRAGKRLALPDTHEGRLDDLIATAKAHMRGFPRPKAERGGATRANTRSACSRRS